MLSFHSTLLGIGFVSLHCLQVTGGKVRTSFDLHFSRLNKHLKQNKQKKSSHRFSSLDIYSSPPKISVACLQFWVFSHNGDPWNWVQYFGCAFALGGGDQSQRLISWLQNLIHPSMFLVFYHCMGTLIHAQIFLFIMICFLFSRSSTLVVARDMARCSPLSCVMILLAKEPLWWCFLPTRVFTSISFPCAHPPWRGKNGHVSLWKALYIYLF